MHRVLPAPDNGRFTLLGQIDRYDTTEFRSVEMADLVVELDRVLERTAATDDRAYLTKLRALAETCRARPRCRPRLVGD